MEQSDVTDLRSSPRFVVREPITGYFGGIDVSIRDMAAAGIQIEHAEPLKLSLKGKVGFKVDSTLFAVPGVVVWSKLSNAAQAQGQLLYRSGIKLEDEAHRFAYVINILMGRGRIVPDVDSLERKRRKLVEREQQKTAIPILKIVVPRQPSIPPDQLLLIQHARERLRSDPHEATKWYNRAKYAMASEEGRLEELNVRHREEVFAVWEYLERSIDVAIVARAFGIKKIG